MTHGICCGGGSSIRMLANAKQQKAAETKDATSKDALTQEKANASKFHDKIKQLSGTFKSKKEPKA